MSDRVAIVGMACRYPEARSPTELWENVLAQRRAFRRIPDERLPLDEYGSDDPSAVDSTYAREAALITDYEFDRVAFRVTGDAFRSADLAHWLALDVAADALRDAGFPDGAGLPRDGTGVLLGNTLTGEFTRAGTLRTRWPFVRRVVDGALADGGWEPSRRRELLRELERRYKSPFPPPGGESLAGGLSNTIAGRICNHFDLHGGGYTVDGACASSLLAVANACGALAVGDLDVAIAGGVDLSLDPFELVGFARAGALARHEMRVYDARSAGFWPGEGCGVLVLMREADAVASGRPVHAVVRGWGVSSDGAGGLTRPEVEGQLLALRRAYRRAAVDASTVAYFEGHGTGTAVGDATELQALRRARRESGASGCPAAVGSVKAIIGHTKAAAGAAGLIKAVMAVRAQILPPTAGCDEPRDELRPATDGEPPALRVLRHGEPWPADRPLRAGVSAMGFGGINTHVVIEGSATERRTSLSTRERELLATPQDAELLLLGGADDDELASLVARLVEVARAMSRAELADLAGALAARAREARLAGGPRRSRAAVVASTPDELWHALEALRRRLADGGRDAAPERGVWLGRGDRAPRIGLLFPGQGSPAHTDGGALRRFEDVDRLYARARLPAGEGVATHVAQPAITTASLAALVALGELGVGATVAVGHSLGELTALHWGGAFDAAALTRIATARGRAMAELGDAGGAMASVAASEREVAELCADCGGVCVAGLNTPRQTVVSGPAADVDALVARARALGWAARRLAVSHAFHSPLVAAAATPLAEHLASEMLLPLRREVWSTVTGTRLAPDEDLRALLARQVTSPVRFLEAVRGASADVDLWLEAGPGHVLAGLARDCVDVPVVSLDAGGPSIRGLLEAVGAAFALGAPIDEGGIARGRALRPFDVGRRPRFFTNPCELVPRRDVADDDAVAEDVDRAPLRPRHDTDGGEPNDRVAGDDAATVLDLVRRIVAARAELPAERIGAEQHLLRDLHLNSINVAQISAEAARRIGLAPSVAPTELANATVGELASALVARRESAPGEAAADGAPPGVDTWVRPFTVAYVERPLDARPVPGGEGQWRVVAPAGHAFAGALEAAFAGFGGGGGVIVCLPPAPDERHLPLLLDGARAVLAQSGPRRFVLVQHGGGGSAFARTLRQEAPHVTVSVVDLPDDDAAGAQRVVAEAAAARDLSEARYDGSGARFEPVMRLLELSAPADSPASALGPDDVLLVTGGGKGITAECTLALGAASRARLVLVGRSDAKRDPELAANLGRFRAAGLTVRYVAADVTDAAALRAAVAAAERDVGPVTAILHGSGVNEPRLIVTSDEESMARALGPKLLGLRNLLAAVQPARLRLLVTFGSVIGRSGLRGAASYALANDWAARLTERVGATHPGCRSLAVEWSLWSGVGMGVRLGRNGAFARGDVAPISIEAGVAMLRRLLAAPEATGRVVVTSRYGGDPPLLDFAERELPLLRFLERPRVFYPGVELVADAELTAERDPYVDDHVFAGERLLPGVMGLEAVTQAACALTSSERLPVLEGVAFERPLVLPAHGPLRLRVAALARERGIVDVVIRCAESAYAVDHVRATCRFDEPIPTVSDVARVALSSSATDGPALSIDPERDVYEDLVFHRGRFRRLAGYRALSAAGCVADVAPAAATPWFGAFLPAELRLGDPGARDTVMHAIQACVPHLTILPVAAERIYPGRLDPAEATVVRAAERSHDGDSFVYDVELTTPEGAVRERWEGLLLRVVRAREPRAPRTAPLLGPYLERRLADLVDDPVPAVSLDAGEGGREARATRLLRRAAGPTRRVGRRTDGRPLVEAGGVAADGAAAAESLSVSVSHAGRLTLAVAGQGTLACDVEPVRSRPRATWEDLLPRGRFALAELIGREAGEDRAHAATRVWSAAECLTKAGAPPDAPLTVREVGRDGWVTLRAGALTVATYIATLREERCPLALAVLVSSRPCSGARTSTGT